MTVTPGTSSRPERTAVTRPMFTPASPAGWPQPMMRSSTSEGSRAGTLARTAFTIWEASSSGRMLASWPLNARPMGERAVATITASGMGRAPGSGSWWGVVARSLEAPAAFPVYPAVTTWVTSASRARLAGWRKVQWWTPGQGTSLPCWHDSVPPGSATTGRSGAWSGAITVPMRWSTPRGDRPCSSGGPIPASSRTGRRPWCCRSGFGSRPAGPCRPRWCSSSRGSRRPCRSGAPGSWRGPTPVRSSTCCSPCTAPGWGSPGRATCAPSVTSW